MPVTSRHVRSLLVALVLAAGWAGDARAEAAVDLRRVTDIIQCDIDWSSYPRHFTELSGGAYFLADDGTHGLEPWWSDGTPEGTRLLADTWPGPRPGINSFWDEHRISHDGIVYFAANDGVLGSELWRTDGTPEGTWLLRDINPGTRPRDRAPLQGRRHDVLTKEPA